MTRRKKIRTNRRSGFEEKFEADLVARNIKYDYEQLKLPYTLNYNYKPDWELTEYGIIVETKGYLDSDDRRKMLAVKQQHPDLDIRFVFQKADKVIRRGSSTTYGDWADKNGFIWAEGVVPKQWLRKKKNDS